VRIAPLPTVQSEISRNDENDVSGERERNHYRREVPSVCIYCNQGFPTLRAMHIHVKTFHTSIDIFKCSMCRIYFKTLQEKQDHFLKVHTAKNQKCIYCNSARFSTVKGLEYHIESCHGSEFLRCSYKHCREYFRSEEEKIEHIQKRHVQKITVKCPFCSFKQDPTTVEEHIKNIHGESIFKCTFLRCLKLFSAREKLDKHILEQHKCIYCNGELVQNLTSHIHWFHKAIAIKCNYAICSAYFHTQEEKQVHILKFQCDKRKRVKCIYCSEMVLNVKMSEHMRKDHEGEYIWYSNRYFQTEEEKQKYIEERRTECIYCKGLFPPDQITHHIKQKHLSEAIRCNYMINCRTYFYSVEERDQHVVEKHMNGKVVMGMACIYCEKTFVGFRLLHDHVRHYHSKIFIKCRKKGCTNYFFNKKEEEKHFNDIHAEIENSKCFKCPKCSFKTNTKKTLKLHGTLSHSQAQGRPFYCSVCKKGFKTRVCLRRHKSNVHGEKTSCIHCKKNIRKRVLCLHLESLICKTCKKLLPCTTAIVKHKKICNV
jgi:hypothetical protein